MSLRKYNTKILACKVLDAVIGLGLCFGALWLVCTVAGALLRLAGVA